VSILIVGVLIQVAVADHIIGGLVKMLRFRSSVTALSYLPWRERRRLYFFLLLGAACLFVEEKGVKLIAIIYSTV